MEPESNAAGPESGPAGSDSGWPESASASTESGPAESDPAESESESGPAEPEPDPAESESESAPAQPESVPAEAEVAPAASEAAQVPEPLDQPGADPATGPVDEPLIHSSTEPPPDAEEGIEDGLLPLSDADLESALEALLLVVDSPAEEEALATALNTTPLRVAEHLRLLSDRYTDQDRGIDLRRAGGGWRFYTRDRYAPYVEKLLLDGQRAKLTRAALETLAVIAYRQPVTRARVAAVRGVNCDGVIRTLLARGLVEETGTDVETGGFLYRTTELFLERLGLSSLDDLPPIAPLLPEVDSIDEL